MKLNELDYTARVTALTKQHKISFENNVLIIDDTIINMHNVLAIKKFDKTRNEFNKYTIGVAGIARSGDMKSWQFIYASDDEDERNLLFEHISHLIQQ